MVDPARSGHFTTVGGAIAAAQPGDRIELLPGTYRESVIVRDDIVISGVGDRESIIVEPAPLPAGIDETDLQRNVFELHDSDARLAGFTVRGARHGSAIVIDGGAPTIEDMVVDPDADMRVGDPNHPHHSIVATSGASPIVRDSLITSLMWIHDGATPFVEGNVVDGACILVEGEGTAPTIRTTEFRDSGCPGFSISVAMGAAATIEAAHVYNSPDTAGIRVAGEGTTVQVSGSNVYGGTAGFIVGNGADLVVYTSQVTNADTGIEIYDADVELATNRFERNTTGLEARGSGQLVTLDNVICDNQVNLDLRDGVAVPVEQNEHLCRRQRRTHRCRRYLVKGGEEGSCRSASSRWRPPRSSPSLPAAGPAPTPARPSR